ncbi:ABC transporter permease [Mucilaginibacter sp.]|uniref:ABC transporter permease n=1 Tax=Mucilaginibacter sp. TaxID=1882438 RepID=UPI003D098DEC
MLKSYINIAFRNLKNRLTFSVINIAGLAVGMAGAILIGLWTQNEFSFENFQTNKTTLYKVWNRTVAPGQVSCWDITSSPIAKTLKDNYPEIKSTARIYWSINRLFNYSDKTIKAQGNDVDKSFLTMFSFPLLKGNAAHALDDIHSVVITQKLAKKIFGDADPINKIVKLDNKDVYKVSGVLKDLPDNTQFDFEYLVSLAANEGFYTDGSWNNNSYYTYVQLQPNASLEQVNAKIRNLALSHSKDANALFLYPFSKMRLYSRFENGHAVGGRIEIVNLLLAIAAIILLIACINFMNLSTAQSQKRAREVGVRKVMGASRLRLIGQFLSESIMIAVLAGFLALILVQLSLPSFNQLTEKSLFIPFTDSSFWLALVGFILITGLLAGSYPAFLLSSFKPVKVLKGMFIKAQSVFNPRKVLVVVQFSIAIVFVVSTIVVYRQIKFAQNRNAGYNINNLIEVPVEGDISKNYPLIKNELISSGAATAMCRTSLGITVDGSTGGGVTWDGMGSGKDQLNYSFFGTSGDFVKTMGLTLVNGRDINFAEYPSDTASCMINEMAVTQMGLKNPVGTLINKGTRKLTIVGVFKDFIIQSPYINVNPMIVRGSEHWSYNTVIRLNARNETSKNLRIAESIFKKYNPAYPFTYQFTDKEYQQKFSDQEQTGTLAFVFAGLAIFISCLGLFGLASYMAENRSKEIGIRKVLGASVAGIAQMLTKEFVALVLVAIVIATPIGWWLMNSWLQGFTYRVNIGWLTFVFAGLIAIIIAVLTVSVQSVKAALSNPVNSIKAE